VRTEKLVYAVHTVYRLAVTRADHGRHPADEHPCHLDSIHGSVAPHSRSQEIAADLLFPLLRHPSRGTATFTPLSASRRPSVQRTSAWRQQPRPRRLQWRSRRRRSTMCHPMRRSSHRLWLASANKRRRSSTDRRQHPILPSATFHCFDMRAGETNSSC
jgi:phytoene dehydrogenase-like protein